MLAHSAGFAAFYMIHILKSKKCHFLFDKTFSDESRCLGKLIALLQQTSVFPKQNSPTGLLKIFKF